MLLNNTYTHTCTLTHTYTHLAINLLVQLNSAPQRCLNVSLSSEFVLRVHERRRLPVRLLRPWWSGSGLWQAASAGTLHWAPHGGEDERGGGGGGSGSGGEMVWRWEEVKEEWKEGAKCFFLRTQSWLYLLSDLSALVFLPDLQQSGSRCGSMSVFLHVCVHAILCLNPSKHQKTLSYNSVITRQMLLQG